MTFAASYFTKSFPKQADITVSPKKAFYMQYSCEKYLQYILGGITAGSIAALGSIASSGSFQYLYLPQIHHYLGQKPIGIVGTLSNKIGKFSCVYIKLSNLMFFPFVEVTASMDVLLKHTDVIQFSAEHLAHTTDWKYMVDPIRGTLLPIFYIVYFGQDIPQ